MYIKLNDKICFVYRRVLKRKKPSSNLPYFFAHSTNGVHCWWVGKENEEEEEEVEKSDHELIIIRVHYILWRNENCECITSYYM